MLCVPSSAAQDEQQQDSAVRPAAMCCAAAGVRNGEEKGKKGKQLVCLEDSALGNSTGTQREAPVLESSYSQCFSLALRKVGFTAYKAGQQRFGQEAVKHCRLALLIP